MKETIRRKFNNTRGTSLGEMLVCVLILLLASSILVGAVTLASKNFEKSFSNSQAQTLASTLTSAVENELRYTPKFRLSGNKLTGYASSSYGKDADQLVMFETMDGELTVSGEKLISSKSYHSGKLNASLDVSWNDAEVGSQTSVMEGSATQKNSGYFSVTLNITSNGKTVERASFDIIPINHYVIERN